MTKEVALRTAVPNAAGMTLEDMARLAQNVAASKLFGIQTAEQALTLMALCQAEGLHPMQAVRRYHLISVGGVTRPSMRTDAMLAEFQARGGQVEWLERSHEVCTARFHHPSGGSVEVSWGIEDARRAGLLKNPTWTQYPRQMLTARVISEGVRTVLPGVCVGIYTPEEVEQSPPAKPAPSQLEPVALPAPSAILLSPPAAPHSAPDDAALRSAKLAFAERARELDHEVYTEDGRPSLSKMVWLLNDVLGREEGDDTAPSLEDWKAATAKLPGWTREYRQAREATAKLRGEEDDRDDPFADLSDSRPDERPAPGTTAAQRTAPGTNAIADGGL